MRRGDVVVADRGACDDAARPRPAVVVQADAFDATSSVVICPLTTVAVDAPLLRVAVEPRRRGAASPWSRVAVEAGATLSLTAESWSMVEKVTAIRRDRVREVIGHLPAEVMLTLERNLAVLLGRG